MKCEWILGAVLCLPASMMAQNALQPGTILPVSLDGSLNAGKVHAGQRIRATVMQDIPGTAIRRGAHVVGEVVQASAAKGRARLEFRFDAVEIQGKSVPFNTDLRAMASFVEVEDAKVPEIMSDGGMTPETWPTEQIGGDQVYRGGGPVAVGDTTVGSITPWGVLGPPLTRSGEPCRGVVAGNDRAQAWWLFSTDACGVYGFGKIRIEHAGRTSPDGVIVLSSPAGKLKVPSGTGLLLRVS